MSTIQHTRSIKTNNTRAFIAAWEHLHEGDEGESLPFSQYTDKSVQVVGSLGGGSVVMEGSNDNGVTWAGLADPQGNALSISAPKLEQVLEIAQLIRPRIVGGSAADVSVYLLVKE